MGLVSFGHDLDLFVYISAYTSPLQRYTTRGVSQEYIFSKFNLENLIEIALAVRHYCSNRIQMT